MGKDSHFTGLPAYSQVLKLLDKDKIRQIRHDTQGSESYVKRFGGYEYLVVMLFGVLKHFDSLRELEIGMKAEAHKLSHLGIDYLVFISFMENPDKTWDDIIAGDVQKAPPQSMLFG